MSEIIILEKPKRHSTPARQAFRLLLVIFTAQFLALSSVLITDNNGYFFLFGHTTAVGSMVTKVIQQVVDGVTGGSSSSSDDDSGGPSGSFDRALISKMEAGYAKDYLKICYDNEQGKLDTKKRSYYADTPTIIGINVSETQCYNISGHVATLPTSDIPVKYITDGTYGKNGVTLEAWCSKNSPHHTKVGGAYAFTPDNVSWTGIHTKSVYNKGTNTPNGIGDGYLMPDAVCGLNDFVASAIKELDIADSLDKLHRIGPTVAAAGAFNHNSGSGVRKALYGISHRASESLIKPTQEETVRRLNIVIDDLTVGTEKLSDADFAKLLANYTNPTPWIASEFCLISQGWLISSEMKSHILGYSSNAIPIWNMYFPEDKIKTSGELSSRLDKYVTSISRLTGISDTKKLDNIYGTANGSYSQTLWNLHLKSQGDYGTLFKIVGDNETQLANSSGMPQVIALPAIPTQHMYASATFGDHIARKMLIYAGIDPSLANKITSSGGSANRSEDQTVGGGSVSFKANSAVLADLKAHGCDVSKLDNARYHVLAAAVKMDGKSTYTWGGAHDHQGCTDLTHTGYDCSSFVKHAVQGSGIDELRNFTMPSDTSKYDDAAGFNVKSITQVPKENWYPADIMRRPGHVLLFVGLKGGRIYTLEAMGSDSSIRRNGWHDRPSIANNYSIYRIKKYYTVDSF